MTDRERVYSGLSNAAWGYFFLHIDFNVNNVSILPRFVGWLLSAIRKLSGERRDLALLRNLVMVLAGWNMLVWLCSWVGADPGGALPAVDLLVEAAGLYFHFQFLTDMAALAEACQPAGGSLDRRLRSRRSALILLSTVTSVLLRLPFGRYEEARTYVALGLLAVMLVVVLLIMGGLFELRRTFRNQEERA